MGKKLRTPSVFDDFGTVFKIFPKTNTMLHDQRLKKPKRDTNEHREEKVMKEK